MIKSTLFSLIRYNLNAEWARTGAWERYRAKRYIDVVLQLLQRRCHINQEAQFEGLPVTETLLVCGPST